LELFNKTPFLFAPLVGRLNFPNHSLTLIVKGTFDLKQGGKAETADEILSPTGDEFYTDDEEMLGSPRYEMDFAWLKPRADLLLAGKCFVPGGKATQACQVTFQVGSKSKVLGVFGNRYWKRNAVGLRTISEPQPFTEMELRYENSFGGEGYAKNPVGKGYNKEKAETGEKLWALPNIEDPLHLINSANNKSEPAGYGPLNRMWELRHSRMGTYKGNYLKKRWPWFPLDFDWKHFNAAPPDMQLEGYLKGDEPLYFENLHPKYPQYHSSLPSLRIRCFVNRKIDPQSNETDFKEVNINIDTLWVDMEAEKMVLVWRGWTSVLSEEYEEVEHIFIMSEPLEKTPQTVDQCYQLFLQTQAEEAEEWEMAAEEPPPLVEMAAAAAIEKPDLKMSKSEVELEDEKEPAREDLIKTIEIQTAAVLAQLGINFDSLPDEIKEKTKTQQEKLIDKLSESDPAKLAAMEQEEQETQLKEEFARLGLDYENPPPLSEKAKEEQQRFMQEVGIESPEVQEDEVFSKLWKAMVALMPSLGINPENMSPLIDQTKEQMEKIKKQLGFEEMETGEEETKDVEAGKEEVADEKGESKAKEDEQAAPLTGEKVQEFAASGESLSSVDLSGLDLSGLDLMGVDFSGAILSGALLVKANLETANLSQSDLKGADLSEANLSTANLAGADLTGAILEKTNLKEADATESILIEANLKSAILSDAIFEKTQATKAVFDEVLADGVYFTEADLNEVSFKNAELGGADFSKSQLHNADFSGANLSDASVEGSAGTGINFTEANLSKFRASDGCDFSQGIFVKATGPESIWMQANLNGANFSFSQMESANFIRTNLEKAILSGSNMKFSRFVKANLREAKMILINLFEGSLEKADLTGADLSGSNLYAAELLEAVINQTKLQGANLKMTKLAN